MRNGVWVRCVLDSYRWCLSMETNVSVLVIVKSNMFQWKFVLCPQVRDRSGVPAEMLSAREGQQRGPSQQATERFPPINNASGGEVVPWVNVQQADSRAASRLEVLEGRLQQQERTTQVWRSCLGITLLPVVSYNYALSYSDILVITMLK